MGGASAQQLLAERGAYLVNGVGGCSNCHTPRGPGGATDLQRDKLLSGSTQTFQAPQYTVKGSNLTPDRRPARHRTDDRSRSPSRKAKAVTAASWRRTCRRRPTPS
jgi:hypothetical protein